MSLPVILVLVVVHVLAGVFWAGSTFAVAAAASADWGPRLFRPQMGAAVVAILSGGALMSSYPRGEGMLVLGIGAAAALVAAGVQGMLVAAPARRLAAAAHGGADAAAAPWRRRILLGNRLAALLLAITVACMAAAMHL